MTPAALYGRVSTSEQKEEGTSLDTQRDLGLVKASDLRWTVSEDHIILEDWTGKDLQRPGLLRLLALARSGRIKGLIIYTLDRLYRPENEGDEWRDRSSPRHEDDEWEDCSSPRCRDDKWRDCSSLRRKEDERRAHSSPVCRDGEQSRSSPREEERSCSSSGHRDGEQSRSLSSRHRDSERSRSSPREDKRNRSSSRHGDGE